MTKEQATELLKDLREQERVLDEKRDRTIEKLAKVRHEIAKVQEVLV